MYSRIQKPRNLSGRPTQGGWTYTESVARNMNLWPRFTINSWPNYGVMTVCNNIGIWWFCRRVAKFTVFTVIISEVSRLRLKCDGTRAEARFRLSAKRTSPFKSAGRQFSLLLAVEVCASAVVMLDTPCSEVVWRVLATHSIRQFPLHFPSRASLCAITFQLDSTIFYYRDPKYCFLSGEENPGP